MIEIEVFIILSPSVGRCTTNVYKEGNFRFYLWMNSKTQLMTKIYASYCWWRFISGTLETEVEF